MDAEVAAMMDNCMNLKAQVGQQESQLALPYQENPLTHDRTVGDSERRGMKIVRYRGVEKL